MRRYLVIGSGSIARRHISNLRMIDPTSEVACVSASGRILSKDETQATTIFPSLDDAITWVPFFGIIASPAPFHVCNAAFLLERGIPVLIEKPLSDSLERYSFGADTLDRFRDRIEIGYNLRYLSSAKRMKDLVDSEIVGELSSILIDMGQYLPDWRPETDYRTNVSARKSLGGGVLLELSHDIDYLTWLFGKFDSVYCLASNSRQLEIDVEDRADIILSKDDGLIAHLHMDFLQRKATRTCKVIGNKGNLIWNLIANTIILETGKKTVLLFDEPSTDRNDMYIEQLMHFTDVAMGLAKPFVGLNDALYTLNMIEAMRLSSVERREVTLKGLC
jgi:predicted dehydrogenase